MILWIIKSKHSNVLINIGMSFFHSFTFIHSAFLYFIYVSQRHISRSFTFCSQHHNFFPFYLKHILHLYWAALLMYLIFGRAGSSLLRGLLSSCGKQGATLECCALASHCSGCCCWGAQAFGAGSAAVAHGHSCSAACGIFPEQGSNPCTLHWQMDS